MLVLTALACTNASILSKQPAVQVDDWCQAITGPPGQRDPAVDLASAHAGIRMFGPGGDWLSVDAALIDVLSVDDPFGPGITEAYASGNAEVCSAPATDSAPTAASLVMIGTEAIVVPGPGSVSLPDHATVVALDLRRNPTASFDDVVRAAALAVDGRRLGDLTVRRFDGFPAQWGDATAYSTSIVDQTVRFDGVGAGLPLVILTPQRLGPGAALAAATLRFRNKATLLGHDVHLSVAESTWTGVGDAGLGWRSSLLRGYPDRIVADISEAHAEAWFGDLDTLPDPQDLTGPTTRSDVAEWDRLAGLPDGALDPATMRAALLVLHGTLERFYPYFDEVGYRIDDALIAALDEADRIDSDDRADFIDVIGRFLHEIDDGHGFYGDSLADPPVGTLAVQFQQIDGEAVVRASAHPQLQPGDTVVAIDGVSADDWYSEAMSRRSAASFGYRFDLATRELKTIADAPRTLEVRDPDGAIRTVEVDAATDDALAEIPWGGTLLPSGWLTPEVYYLNLNGSVSLDVSAVTDQIQALAGTEASLIVDMRDYPAVNHYTVANWLNTDPFSSPEFHVPMREGPQVSGWEIDQYALMPASEPFGGPIAWLVGNKTVSAAENFSQMMVDQPNVTVVGQQSASTNGNITLMWLPGQFYAYFTGMKIRNPDGSDFHGVGIVPDVVVQPTPEDFAAGIDPELEAALDLLGG